MKLKEAVCQICGSNKTYLQKRKEKYYECWFNFLNGKICKRCYSKIKYKDKHKVYSATYHKKHPEIAQAHAMIQKRKFLKKDFCEKCLQKNVKLEAHHPDYSKPLKVITLCIPCHKKIHKERRILNV